MPTAAHTTPAVPTVAHSRPTQDLLCLQLHTILYRLFHALLRFLFRSPSDIGRKIENTGLSVNIHNFLLLTSQLSQNERIYLPPLVESVFLLKIFFQSGVGFGPGIFSASFAIRRVFTVR